MPHVLIPAPYRGPTAGRTEVEVPAGTVLACIERVEELHPGFGQLVVDDVGIPQRWVRLYLNDEPIEPDAIARLEVGEGDRLEVLAAVAGG